MEYGCIGEKLSHSFSKEIHNLLFDYDYEIKEIAKNQLEDFMLSKNFKAINVTIPYKEAVIPFLYEISDTARKIGAVNTIVNRNGKLLGFNTDFSGMTNLIKQNGIEICGKKVLVLGSGGTSKTAVAVANSLGALSVVRVSRTAKEDCIDYDTAYNKYADTQVIINTTPCGMYPNIVGEPINIEKFLKLEAVVDAVYNPLNSNLVVNAKKRGLKATGGLYMLVSQAVTAAELFTNTKITPEKVYNVYKKIEQSKRNIVLIGMPSSGKTTIGKNLALDLQMQFIDTDEEIERITGRKIPDILKNDGETEFRNIESKVISTVSALQNCVISTGGGAVLKEQNATVLKGNGTVYFIDRDIENLVATSDRPLSSNRDDLQKRYNERYGIYCSIADKQISNNGELITAVNNIKEDFLK